MEYKIYLINPQDSSKKLAVGWKSDENSPLKIKNKW